MAGCEPNAQQFTLDDALGVDTTGFLDLTVPEYAYMYGFLQADGHLDPVHARSEDQTQRPRPALRPKVPEDYPASGRVLPPRLPPRGHRRRRFGGLHEPGLPLLRYEGRTRPPSLEGMGRPGTAGSKQYGNRSRETRSSRNELLHAPVAPSHRPSANADKRPVSGRARASARALPPSQPFTQMNCFNLATTSTRSRCCSITWSMFL